MPRRNRAGVGAGTEWPRKRLFLVLLLLWASLTFVLTSLPNADLPVRFRFSDKAAHLGFYAVMGLLCGLWRRASGVPTGRAILQALLFIALFGAVDEVHQHFIPGRSMELADWFADLVGGGGGSLFSAVLPRFFPVLLTE